MHKKNLKTQSWGAQSYEDSITIKTKLKLKWQVTKHKPWRQRKFDISNSIQTWIHLEISFDDSFLILSLYHLTNTFSLMTCFLFLQHSSLNNILSFFLLHILLCLMILFIYYIFFFLATHLSKNNWDSSNMYPIYSILFLIFMGKSV